MDKIRAEIDKLDNQMRIIFEKRLDCVKKVIEYKFNHDLEIFDHQREQLMIERNLRQVDNQAYKKAYLRFLKEVIQASKEFQQDWLDNQQREGEK